MTKTKYFKDNYLPEFLKDFHDQKKLFKLLSQIKNQAIDRREKNCILEDIRSISFMDYQILIIDYFLWYMGKCGYKLQKWNTDQLKFYDLSQKVMEFTDEQDKVFFEFLKQRREQRSVCHN